MADLTMEQRLERAHVTLMGSMSFCLLSGIIMVGKTTITDDDEIPTAGTDGYNTYYNRKFCAALPDKHLNFVVAHENYHKMLRQLSVWQRLFKQNAQAANMAADYVINLLIMDADPRGQYVQLPQTALYDTQYAGMDTQQVFNKLMQNAQKQGGNGHQGKPGQGPLDQHDWAKAGKVSEEEQGKRDTQIDQAIRQGQILAGKRAGGRNRDIDALIEPAADWRKAMADFVTEVVSGRDISTWAKPNRRFMAQGVYMPSSYSERVGKVLIGVDTSGSVGGELLAAFMSNVVAIAAEVIPEEIHLLYWDAEVAAHEIYVQGQYETLLASTKPAGGGGTAPSCVTAYMREKKIEPACAVMLTDGYVGDDWGGAWPCPVLWCVIGNKNATPSVGRVVNVRE